MSKEPPSKPSQALSPPVAGIDYYMDPDSGLLVMTEHYLKRRGYCCKNGCRHCPYGFRKDGKQAPNPSRANSKLRE